uniref:Putative secreted protein n=1 Tax=Ixodes ricinus TaxID=34613 RepID=A0A6B0UPT7_IXORI
MATVVGYLPVWLAAHNLLTGLLSPLPGAFGCSGHETSWPTKMAEIPTVTRLTILVCPHLASRKVRPKRCAREGTLIYLSLKILLLQNIPEVVLFRINDNIKPAVTLSLTVLAIAHACHVLRFLLSG